MKGPGHTITNVRDMTSETDKSKNQDRNIPSGYTVVSNPVGY